MIKIRVGTVVKIKENFTDIQVLLVTVEGQEVKAINYPQIAGSVEVGDQVQLKTTAVSLGLGTGGYHFVLANLTTFATETTQLGHIMKLRYTPQQIKVTAVEEEVSPLHEAIKNFISLENTPVIIGSLHSMLLPAIAGIKAINPQLRVDYIMTDGAALPISFSNTVRKLNELKWLEGTITVGNAFGGELEAVNIYSGLATAFIRQADIIVVIMGPGIVGTGTELGTTALEVGQIINAVHSLKGQPLVIPRINFHDSRERHIGISHHVITVLTKIALAPATVIFPKLNDRHKIQLLQEQITKNKLAELHNIVFADGSIGLEYLLKQGLKITTMNRTVDTEKEYFLTACATGTYAAQLNANNF